MQHGLSESGRKSRVPVTKLSSEREQGGIEPLTVSLAMAAGLSALAPYCDEFDYLGPIEARPAIWQPYALHSKRVLQPNHETPKPAIKLGKFNGRVSDFVGRSKIHAFRLMLERAAFLEKGAAGRGQKAKIIVVTVRGMAEEITHSAEAFELPDRGLNLFK